MTGTIRKAQNLLKQYSQHGLDGKKGGSNLIPLEGNHPVLLPLFHCVSAYLSGRAEPPPGECGTDPEGAGWQRQTPDAPQASAGPRTSFIALILPGSALPKAPAPCPCPCVLCELREHCLGAALSRPDQQGRTKLARASWLPASVERVLHVAKGTGCLRDMSLLSCEGRDR